MLVVLTTDAVADAAALDAALRAATAVTFDRVDSDGCMSTNDTVLLLACGASGVTPSQAELADGRTRGVRGPGPPAPRRRRGCEQGHPDRRDACRQRGRRGRGARAVARSNLFKCAVHGEDPNWGRVLSAVGTTDATFEPRPGRRGHQRRQGRRGGAAGDDRSAASTSPVARSSWPSTSGPARRTATRVDQRPHRRLRPRELGVLHMTLDLVDQPSRAGPGQDRSSSTEALPWLETFHGRPSS